jgi:hypothetical protein
MTVDTSIPTGIKIALQPTLGATTVPETHGKALVVVLDRETVKHVYTLRRQIPKL